MANRKQLTRPQIMQIGNMLRGNLKILENNKVEYCNGYDDAKVAERFQVTAVQIAGLRKELFGELERGINGTNPMMLAWERIKAIEDRVTALEEQATKPKPAMTNIGAELARKYNG